MMRDMHNVLWDAFADEVEKLGADPVTLGAGTKVLNPAGFASPKIPSVRSAPAAQIARLKTPGRPLPDGGLKFKH